MKKRKKIIVGDVLIITALILFIMVLSLILSKIGLNGAKTTIVNKNLETSLITINNIFSVEGLRFIIGNFITNVKIFEPLILIICVLITMSIVEYSEVLKCIGLKLKKINIKFITFLVLLVGMLGVFFGEYSFLILMPFFGLLYKEMGKSPILGILTVFLGITLGFGAGFIFDYNDYILGGLTELAATIDVDPNYKFVLTSTIYIKIISSVVIIFVLGNLINSRLVKLLPKYKEEKSEEIEIIEEDKKANKAFLYSVIFLIIYIVILALSLLPNSFLSPILLDKTGDSYLVKLFSDISPFREGIFFFTLIGLVIFSIIYGKNTKKIKKLKDIDISFASYFQNTGHLFVIMFLIAELIAILNWTNISDVIAVNLIEFMSKLEFSGLMLIVTLFIITFIIGIFIPSTAAKWSLLSPLTVPLFMRSNLTPAFTHFIFRAADGAAKSLSLIFPYYIIMVGLINKYDNENNFSVFNTIKLIFPIVLTIILIWVIILCGFYIIGLPIGPGSNITL